MELTKKQQRSFLIGTILGDSSMTGKKNKSLVSGHIEAQYDYLLLKQSILEQYCPVGVTIKEKTNSSGYARTKKFFQLYSTSHHKLTALYNLIYFNKTKCITSNLLSKLDEVGIASLFMDDGCKETTLRKDGTRRIGAYKISMNSFSEEEVIFFSVWMKDTFDIDSKVYLEHRKYPCLKITTESNRQKFKTLIEPYILNSFMYKLYV